MSDTKFHAGLIIGPLLFWLLTCFTQPMYSKNYSSLSK